MTDDVDFWEFLKKASQEEQKKIDADKASYVPKDENKEKWRQRRKTIFMYLVFVFLGSDAFHTLAFSEVDWNVSDILLAMVTKPKPKPEYPRSTNRIEQIKQQYGIKNGEKEKE